MKVFTILNSQSITNIYFITDDTQREGILIDPGSFALNVYNDIKNIGAEIKKIIITHNDYNKVHAIPIIQKIFDVEVYAHSSSEYDFKVHRINHGELIYLGGEPIEVLATPVRSYDSISLKMGNAIFTGDVLQTGGLSSINHSKAPSQLELSIIKKHFVNLPLNTIVYPEKGPATTIEIERKFNPYFKMVIENENI